MTRARFEATPLRSGRGRLSLSLGARVGWMRGHARLPQRYALRHRRLRRRRGQRREGVDRRQARGGSAAHRDLRPRARCNRGDDRGRLPRRLPVGQPRDAGAGCAQERRAVRRDHQLRGAGVGLQLDHRPARRHAVRRRQRRRGRRRRRLARAARVARALAGAAARVRAGVGVPARAARPTAARLAAGAGGAIDSGVDTTGCVFQSAEDCFNGIDDDCNGHTDCDDPACNGSTTCVPAAGSNGFVPGAYVDPVARLSGALRRRRVDDQRHARPRRRLHRLLV